MMRQISGFIVCLVLTGCLSNSTPKDSQPQNKIKAANDLVGCYKNLGESAESSSARYLSQIIWPELSFEHGDIDQVMVKLLSDKTLSVTGIEKEFFVAEKLLKENEHFTLNAGEIKIKSDLTGSAAYPPGNPFIGIGYDSLTLGRDIDGNGVLTSTIYFAGTVFILFPILGGEKVTTRFSKVSCIEGG